MIYIKYMGSKSRIAKYIVPIIQEYIDENNIKCYIEPFCGGANIIDKIKCNNKIASDNNKYLIALLQRVQSEEYLLENVPKELYDKARVAFNIQDTSEFEDWEIGNIGFLASYNGRWFDGGYAKAGYEKTKSGLRYRDYYQESKNNIMNQASSLKDISFEVCDYKDYTTVEDCLIYCDPLYQGVKQFLNSISFDYDEFWGWCRFMSKKNVVIISELNAPDDFECIWEKEVSRSIKATDKGRAIEKLFKMRK